MNLSLHNGLQHLRLSEAEALELIAKLTTSMAAGKKYRTATMATVTFPIIHTITRRDYPSALTFQVDQDPR